MNNKFIGDSNPVLISTGSTRVKSGQLSRETLSVESFIPEELASETQKLIAFFEQYYQWMNQEYVQISTENETQQTNVSRGGKSLYLKRSPDQYIDANAEEIQKLFSEVAAHLPNNTAIDFRTVLKHILSLYNQKGSGESIQSFFRILYNIAASVYYPWDDVLIASDGRWDGEKFISNKGFLSDKIYLQDSNYWQRFSYDIKVGIQEQEWRHIFEALIHPAGFKFFASYVLLIFGAMNKDFRKGRPAILLSDDARGVTFKILILALMENKPIYLDTLFQMMWVRKVENESFLQTFTSLSFYNSSAMNTFDTVTMEDLTINNKKLNIGSHVRRNNTALTYEDIEFMMINKTPDISI